jgi:uncharacterized protein YjiS (DUF1127 family)
MTCTSSAYPDDAACSSGRPEDRGQTPRRVARIAAYLWAGGLAPLVRRAWRAYWAWRARRVTVMLLQSLDDRTLHDIGISPSEIESLVHCPIGRRRRYDASWLWR